MRFSLKGKFNRLILSDKAKLAIKTIKELHYVGIILSRSHGLNRSHSWDRSSKKQFAPTTTFTTS
jgi:hypothetical protein